MRWLITKQRMDRRFDLIIFDWNGTIEQTETTSRNTALRLLSASDHKLFHQLYKEEKRRLKDLCKEKPSTEYHKDEALKRVFVRICAHALLSACFLTNMQGEDAARRPCRAGSDTSSVHHP